MTTYQANVKVLVDWVNNPLGAGAAAGGDFTDISDYVSLAAGVRITRGREDNISSVQPSRCTFTVTNDDGRFTPNKSTSPYSPGVILGRRVQVSVMDETSTWQVRFDGQIAAYNPNDTPTGEATTTQIVCTDILSFVNRFPELSCWTVQECQYQATPALQYLMNEPANSQGVYDSSGNNGPMLAQAFYDNPPYTPMPIASDDVYLATPTITFQSGNNPVEGAIEPTMAVAAYTDPLVASLQSPLPSVGFEATLTNNLEGNNAATAGPSAQFQGLLPSPLVVGTDNFTLLGWVWPDASILLDTLMNYTLQMLCLSNTRTGAMLSIEDNDDEGNNTFRGAYYANYVKYNPTGSHSTGFSSGSYIIADAPFMVALVVSGTTATFYLGGNIYGSGIELLTDGTTVTLPSGASFNYLSLGGPIGGGNGFVGNISTACLYNEALTSTQLTDLGQIGAIGCQNLTSGEAFTRAAIGYTGVPSYWTGTIDTGLSELDYLDITGSNPQTVIQQIQMVEKGLVFVGSDGKLNCYDRSRRMGAAAPAVTLPAGSYNAGIKPKVNDQYLINYEALQNERGGSGVVAADQDSVDQYGVYPNGSVQSPVTAPWPTWQGNQVVWAVSGGSSPTLFLYNNANIFDAGSWDVNTMGEPAQKLTALTVDMLGNLPGQDEYVAPSTLFGLEINDPLGVDENLPWWPDGPMSNELFIEGITESYSLKEASIGFYTSPAVQSRAWIPGSTAYGELDFSARVGLSQATDPNVIGEFVDVPDFTSTMNLGAGAEGFVGSRDLEGISQNLQNAVRPPLLFVQQSVNHQSVSSTALMVWDTTMLDTASGMNVSSDPGTTYTVPIDGWYEVYATVNFAASGTGQRGVWITQNQNGNNRAVAPVSCKGTTTGATGLTTSAVFYCFAGNAIAVTAFTNSTVNTSLTNGGSHMSVRFLGQGPNWN